MDVIIDVAKMLKNNYIFLSVALVFVAFEYFLEKVLFSIVNKFDVLILRWPRSAKSFERKKSLSSTKNL